MNSSNQLPILTLAMLGNSAIDTCIFVVFSFNSALLIFSKCLSIHVLQKIVRKDVKDKSHGNMFYYLLSNEIADLIIGFVLSTSPLFRCTYFSNICYNYYVKVFELVFYAYLNNSLSALISLLELSFAIERLNAFNPNHRETIRYRTKIILLVTVSFLYCLIYYSIFRTFKPIGILTDGKTNQTLILANGGVGDPIFYYVNIVLTVLTVIRGPILYVVILILNSIIFLKFRARLNEKKRLTSPQTSAMNPQPSRSDKTIESRRLMTKKETRITKVLLFLSLNYLIGNLGQSTTALAVAILGNRSIIFQVYSIAAWVLSVISRTNNITVYYFTSHVFRKIFKKTFFKRD